MEIRKEKIKILFQKIFYLLMVQKILPSHTPVDCLWLPHSEDPDPAEDGYEACFINFGCWILVQTLKTTNILQNSPKTQITSSLVIYYLLQANKPGAIKRPPNGSISMSQLRS